MYILTTNRLTVNENLIGRPGRIRYIQEFRNLPVQAVIDYCNDNLNDRSKLDQVLAEVDLLEISTIDILKSIVEEINIFGQLSEGVQMNIPKAKYLFDTVRIAGVSKEDFPEIERIIDATNPNHKSMYDWYNSYIKISDLPEDLLARGMKSQSFLDSLIAVDEEVEEEAPKPQIPRNVIDAPAPRLSATVETTADKLSSAARPVKKSRKKAPKKIQVIHASALFQALLPNCTWSSDYRMTSNFKELWRDLDTSLGMIVEQPNHHGLFIIQDQYDKSETVYLLLRQKNNPSLYRGGLGLIL